MQLFVLLTTLILFVSDFRFSPTCYVRNAHSLQRCDVYPLLTVGLNLLLPCLPSKVFRRKYRRQLLQGVLDVMRAPYAHVSFAGNLIGDILTSFTLPLADLEWMCCYSVHILSGR